MLRKRSILLILLFAVAVADLSAQYNSVLYFMNLPQRNNLNPALRSTNRVYLGLPGISDISVKVDNNFLRLTDIFVDGVISDSTVSFLEGGESLNSFLDGLGDYISLEPHVSVQLFSLGFSAGKDAYFKFDITERVEGNFVFPGDLLRLGLEGHDSFVGESIDLSSFRTDLKAFHEIGAGFSKNITEKLRLGIRGKMLIGLAAVNTENNGLTLTVNDDYTHTLDANMAMTISGPLTFVSDEEGHLEDVIFDEERFDDAEDVISYLKNTENMGFGLDLGAEYKFNDKFAVSAALTDFGFIKWANQRSKITLIDQIEFSGNTFQDVYDETITVEELMEQMLDSLDNSILVSDLNEAFTTRLPMGLTAGASLNLTKSLSLGVLSYTKFMGENINQSTTFSANINLGSTLSTTVAYTMENRRHDNLGFGLALRGSFLQFYTLVENVPLKWSEFSIDGNPYKLPDYMNTVQLRVGLNMVFGNKLKKKDEITEVD